MLVWIHSVLQLDYNVLKYWQSIADDLAVAFIVNHVQQGGRCPAADNGLNEFLRHKLTVSTT